jgi:transglutaminase-like putative cysteine protease
MASLYPQPRPVSIGALPSGPAGIAATLKVMVRLARQFKKDPAIREVAAGLIRSLPQYDTMGEVKALHAFVRDGIRYTNDINRVETVQTPKATLELGIGDCDDKSLLLAALLESIGRPARFVAIGMNGRPLSHVLTEVRHGPAGKWVPLETIRPVEVGWYPDGVTSKMIAHV